MNLCTCSDCRNRLSEFQLGELFGQLIDNGSEDDSYSDDEYHYAMDNDGIDISDYNRDNHLF